MYIKCVVRYGSRRTCDIKAILERYSAALDFFKGVLFLLVGRGHCAFSNKKPLLIFLEQGHLDTSGFQRVLKTKLCLKSKIGRFEGGMRGKGEKYVKEDGIL